MANGEVHLMAMAMTVDEILEHVRALPPREQVKLIERVAHEVVDAVPAARAEVGDDAPWADMPDDEFESLMTDIRRTRSSQPMRAGG